MTIERSEKAHWRAPWTVTELQPGFKEVVQSGYGSQDVLVVDSPDTVTIITQFDLIHHYPKSYTGDELKNAKINPFPVPHLLSALMGARVAYSWKPTEGSTSIVSPDKSTPRVR